MKRKEFSNDQITQILLACGVVGGLLFIIVFLVLGVTISSYNPMGNTVSSLAIGNHGWIQILNFLVTGLLMLAFAQGLRRTISTGYSKKWGPRLITTFGIGLIGAGVFVTDPEFGYPHGAPLGPAIIASWHGNLHGLFSIIVFASLIAACFVFARRFWSQPRSRKWAIYSISVGIVVGVFVIATNNSTMYGLTHLAGLLQRTALVFGWSWIVLLALRLIAEFRTEK